MSRHDWEIPKTARRAHPGAAGRRRTRSELQALRRHRDGARLAIRRVAVDWRDRGALEAESRTRVLPSGEVERREILMESPGGRSRTMPRMKLARRTCRPSSCAASPTSRKQRRAGRITETEYRARRRAILGAEEVGASCLLVDVVRATGASRARRCSGAAAAFACSICRVQRRRPAETASGPDRARRSPPRPGPRARSWSAVAAYWSASTLSGQCVGELLRAARASGRRWPDARERPRAFTSSRPQLGDLVRAARQTRICGGNRLGIMGFGERFAGLVERVARVCAGAEARTSSQTRGPHRPHPFEWG